MVILLAGVSIGQTYTGFEIISINISGNEHLKTSLLLDELNLKEKRLFSDGSFYNSHHLAREVVKLEKFYTMHGFLDVSIRDSIAQAGENAIQLYLIVDEGKEYYLQDITLSGNTVFSDEQYLELIQYQVGRSFNTFEIRENLIEMVALYQDNGYPLIHIKDTEVVDDSVSLFITVNEGPKLSIGSINISESEQIPEHIIRREIIIHQGDLFNLTNIQESRRRLYETNLFNSVNIRKGKVDTVNSAMNLDVEVIPAKFRGFDMNVKLKQGFSPYAVGADKQLSLGLSGSWYHNNLFDQSRKLRIIIELSSIYPAIFIPQQFDLNFFYIEPWLYKFRVPLTLNPYLIYIDRPGPNDDQGYKLNAYGLRTIMTYRWFRRVKIQSIIDLSRSNSEGTPEADEEVPQTDRSVVLKTVWDERNHFFFPTSGFKLELEPGLVGYFLGGEHNYVQLQASVSTYWNLFGDVVFAHNLDLAVRGQRDADAEIPYEKRFYLGGNSSIRGWDHRLLGPKVLHEDQLVPVGGNFRYFTNFEIRFPVYSYLGGEVFFDLGNIWPTLADADFSDIQAAYGFGLTVKTPIGPARIDYGIPLTREDGSKSGQIHIAIAYAF
ncbi:MAG: BamA/TamA family outer membrane protein [Candidatus Marinimicrobia bacterium]|nr:BamA/TamA family outer membrane protein [Candidatus Neomarinimicrobiota bacterium]MCF7904558.1 BamA/TamA family outer membrane protein [Candidatus Neomarinimicrobiota bacterium]